MSSLSSCVGWPRSNVTRGLPGGCWPSLVLATKEVSLLAGPAWAMHWPHLQGAGALALMILAVMTRAALGHTGRDMVAAPAIATAYVLLPLAALARLRALPDRGRAAAAGGGSDAVACDLHPVPRRLCADADALTT